MLSNIHIGVNKEHRLRKWTPSMLTNIHIGVDKEHRLRKFTPIDVIKYSYRRRQGTSFAEVDAYQCYQIFM